MKLSKLKKHDILTERSPAVLRTHINAMERMAASDISIALNDVKDLSDSS